MLETNKIHRNTTIYNARDMFAVSEVFPFIEIDKKITDNHSNKYNSVYRDKKQPMVAASVLYNMKMEPIIEQNMSKFQIGQEERVNL